MADCRALRRSRGANPPTPISLDFGVSPSFVPDQVTAQKNQWELDKLQTQSEMLKKFAVDEVDSHSKEGAYIIGLSMQGARWDPNAVSIEKSKARNDPFDVFCNAFLETRAKVLVRMIVNQLIPMDFGEYLDPFVMPHYLSWETWIP